MNVLSGILCFYSTHNTNIQIHLPHISNLFGNILDNHIILRDWVFFASLLFLLSSSGMPITMYAACILFPFWRHSRKSNDIQLSKELWFLTYVIMFQTHFAFHRHQLQRAFPLLFRHHFPCHSIHITFTLFIRVLFFCPYIGNITLSHLLHFYNQMDELRCMSLHIFIIGSLQTIYFEMIWTQRNRHSDSGIYSNSVFCVCVTRHRFQCCPTIDETRSIFGVVVLRQYWAFTLLLNYWKKTFLLGIKQKRGQNSSNLEPILNEYQTLSRNFHWIRASVEMILWEENLRNQDQSVQR